jgi:hypothetical protein
MTATVKPHTYAADLGNLPKALQHLTSLPRWVVWRWVKRARKDGTVAWTKPPFQVHNPNLKARSNDPRTWGDYEAAVRTVETGLADGIGLMLKDSEVAAADLDKARDAQTGELISWAQKLCDEADQLGLYREITVSGAGLRFIGSSEQGSELHTKFTFDRKTGAGIELYRNCARYITISGLQENSAESLGSIDGYLDTLKARYDGMLVQIGSGVSSADPYDFNNAGPQRQDYFRELIENGAPEGERSEKFQEVVWHLAANGLTIEQIVDELAKHPNGIGVKYANRLLAEVTRSFGKWQARCRANATGTAPAAMPATAAPWPQIKVVPGELPRVINEAENALLQSGREIYQRGGLLVRPVLDVIKASGDREIEGWQIIEVIRPWLLDQLGRAAQFQHYDGRSKKFVPIDVPDKVADGYLGRRGTWKVPQIAGVANAPFLHANGTIHDWEGYDPVSGLLCKWDGQIFPSIPRTPSKNDALAALAELKKPLAEFPFVTNGDKSAALSAMLTCLDRRGMNIAPLHAFTAPAPGTGKGLAINVIAVIASGHTAVPIDQSCNEEEFKKCLGSALIRGYSVIAIDNCEHILKSSLLNIAVTEPIFAVRVLGVSQNREIPNNAMFFANGNNLVIGADLTRRTIRCEMDAGVERPEQRKFADDHLLDTITGNRPQMVVAGLTVLRAWHVARPNEQLRLDSMGFTEWSHRVREALVWLGEDDPASTMEATRKDDPFRAERVAVFTEWHKALGETATLVRDVIADANKHPDFYAALFVVAAAKSGKEISPERLGRWLVRNRGLIVNGLTLVRGGAISGALPLWAIRA